jgi:hypothetical protein
MSSKVEGKEYEKVNELYQNVQHTEFLTVYNLNRSMPYAWICAGLIFEIRASHQYGHFDAMLCWIKENREKKIIIKIELEYGKNQDKWNWNTDLPSRTDWHRGISLLTRKDYDGCQLFVKMSPTYNSIILVDTRNKFVDNNTTIDTTPLTIGMETDKECHIFNWDTVDKNKVITMGNGIIQDGNIFLLEMGNSTLVEERRKMYEFVDRKYFTDSIRNKIKEYEIK